MARTGAIIEMCKDKRGGLLGESWGSSVIERTKVRTVASESVCFLSASGIQITPAVFTRNMSKRRFVSAYTTDTGCSNGSVARLPHRLSFRLI